MVKISHGRQNFRNSASKQRNVVIVVILRREVKFSNFGTGKIFENARE